MFTMITITSSDKITATHTGQKPNIKKLLQHRRDSVIRIITEIVTRY